MGHFFFIYRAVYKLFSTSRDMAIMQYMDEILIEEKKYVSSKQAAKMTGYAKDYIGQLCREGRVPARLVGRSWYVLESAIQDHRFGTQEAERAPQAATPMSLTQTWESARYESSSTEALPSLNRLDRVEMASEMEKDEEREAIQLSQLHDSWKEWFDHVGDAQAPVPEEPAQPVTEAVVAAEESAVEEKEADEEVFVPLHVVEKRPLRELLPLEKAAAGEEERKEAPVWVERRQSRSVSILSIAHAALMLVVAISVTLAASGSGYLDSFFISNSQASVISGISVINK